MPDIVVEHCLFDSLDCRHIWDVRKTKEEFQIAFFRLIARLIGRFLTKEVLAKLISKFLFKLGNCLVFDLHHEITDGHFIHLRFVFNSMP